jgi:hypothetical protein
MSSCILTAHSLEDDCCEGIMAPALSPVVFHAGDISYARGYASLWEGFSHQIGTVASHVLWMTADGNLERDFLRSGSYYNGSDSCGECGAPYNRRLMMPIFNASLGRCEVLLDHVWSCACHRDLDRARIRPTLSLDSTHSFSMR